MIRLLVLGFVLAGCGPRLGELAAQRHYREAVCAAHDGSADDRALVRRAIAADADPHVHVELVGAQHLERVIGAAAAGVAGRARFVRIKLQTNVLPVDDVDAIVALTDPRAAALPVTWTVLAAITGEQLPPKDVTWTRWHRGNTLRLFGAFLTFGLSLPFTGLPRRDVEVDPPDHVFRAHAPVAHALHSAMENGCRPLPSLARGAGVQCTWYVALDRSTDAELRLAIALHYRANRASRRATEACSVEQRASITLGRGGERTGELFGSRMRRLADLTID